MSTGSADSAGAWVGAATTLRGALLESVQREQESQHPDAGEQRHGDHVRMLKGRQIEGIIRSE